MIEDELRLDSRPVANPAHALWEHGAGWAALVNLDTLAALALNETGLLVWKSIDGRRTVADVASVLEASCSAPPPAVEGDVLHFLTELLDIGLIGFEVET